MANISGLIPKFYSMTASAERLMELENLPDEKELNQLENISSVYESMKNINIENISFSYKNDLVLSNASAVIEKGELVAIAGPSGIGKSTLMKLFLGLIEPKNGSIFFDTTSGKIDITSGTRRMFSYVPQGNFCLLYTSRCV